MRTLLTAAVLAATTLTATSAFAGECPADAPEGYQWLGSYVEEFDNNGTVNNWFTGSFAENPDDFALRALQAYFDAQGDTTAAQQLYIDAGGSAESFANAMACAGVGI